MYIDVGWLVLLDEPTGSHFSGSEGASSHATSSLLEAAAGVLGTPSMSVRLVNGSTVAASDLAIASQLGRKGSCSSATRPGSSLSRTVHPSLSST